MNEEVPPNFKNEKTESNFISIALCPPNNRDKPSKS